VYIGICKYKEILEMKARIEWKDGDPWRQADVQLRCSKRGNQYFTHNGALYVFSSFKEGCEVVTKTKEGPWIRGGRVCRNGIFLGEGLSWSEFHEQKFKNETTFPKVVMA